MGKCDGFQPSIDLTAKGEEKRVVKA